MLKSIRKWLGLCDHRWRIIREGDLITEGKVAGRYYKVVSRYYTQQCEHCGKLKEVQF